MSVTQRLFLWFSELQLWEDGVFMSPRRLDAVDVAAREPDGVRATQARALLDPQEASRVRLCGEGEEAPGRTDHGPQGT